MAHVRKLPSGKWRGLYQDERRKERTAPGGPFRLKNEAMRAAQDCEARARKMRAASSGIVSSDLTWGAWSEIWVRRRSVEASTSKTDMGRLRNYLEPRWQNEPLQSINRGAIREWLAELVAGQWSKNPISASTVQRILHLFSASLEEARQDELIAHNPAQGMRFSVPDNSRDIFLTQEQFADLLGTIDERYVLAVRVLAHTGMRLGEAVALHAKNVNPRTHQLQVRDNWDEASRSIKPYPKGKKRRFVPVPEWLAIEAATRAASGAPCGQQHVGGRCDGPLLLTSPRGSVLGESALRKALSAAASEIGVPDLRIHDLRHTYASWLIQNGVSLAEVQRLLGHKSIQTTERYAHLGSIPDQQVLDALPTDTIPERPRLRLA